MIYEPNEYVHVEGKIPKAGVLSELYVANFPVPPFVIISQDELTEGVPPSVLETVIAKLPVNRYAVRFASGSEDTETASAAGRFHSVIGVSADELRQSITEVLTKSIPLTNGAPYVLIIQQAILADVSGVIFSRDPFNSRYRRLEQGSGTSSVVAGESNTETLQFLVGQSIMPAHAAYIVEVVELSARIEQLFNFPQDIEWCVSDSHVYLVQSRPISSYTKADWRGIKLIDTHIAGKRHVYWRKAEGMETYDHPTPLDFSLLKFLHAPLGAVETAYARFGLRYTATDQYVLLGNTLYVDPEREQQQLLPSYSLQEPEVYRLRYFPLRRLIITASNQTQLRKNISLPVITQIVNELRVLLTTDMPAVETAQEMLDILTMQYQTIFCINHLIVRGGLDSTVESDSTLARSIRDLRQSRLKDLVLGVTLGNSLALGDESVFAATEFSDSKLSDELREVARWQSVRLRSFMERSLCRNLTERKIDESLLHFFTIESWTHNTFDIQAAEIRRKDFQQYKEFNFPPVVSTFESQEENEEIRVLATGTARGVLVDTVLPQNGGEKPILYTETLSPQIIPLLSNVSGVLCRYGGTLSHAAIVARELRIPVIRTRSNLQEKLGRLVSIKADTVDEAEISFEETS